MMITAGALAAFGVTLSLGPLVLRVIRHRLVDHPNHRSSHKQATPRGGGVAIVFGALAGSTAIPALSKWHFALIVTAIGFGVLGLLDDILTLPVLPRLGGQIVLGSAVLPLLLDDLTGPLAWKVIFACGALLWIVSCINAFNFMDGINGISVAQTLVAGTSWWVVGEREDVSALAAGGLVIASCALGFAPFNYPRARMFLGDVGSYFVGAWLAVLVIVGLRAGIPIEAIIAPMAVALADTLSTILRRIHRRDAWHEAHREHVYQRLVDGGLTHTITSALVAFTVAACSAAGAATIAFQHYPQRLVFDGTIVIILVVYLYSPMFVARSPDR